MQKVLTPLPEIKLLGIIVRTSYEDALKINDSKIFPCVQTYFQKGLPNKIPHRKKPGTTFCAYTSYESDYKGAYTFFIGEEVNTLDEVPEGLTSLIIPQQNYAKFTTPVGSMPSVLLNAWQEIWAMSPEALGGPRRYHTDFEIYDERADDHDHLVLDIYVGIK